MPKRYLPSSSSSAGEAGFSLLEMLVGMSVTLVVTGAALGLTLSTRQLYEADQSRVRLNQNLRAAQDLITTDVQHAGERLGVAFPILEIVDGAAGAPDQLIVRRNLLDTVLNVCWDVAGTQAWIVIGLSSGFSPPPEPGCFLMPGGENIGAWRNYRQANGAAEDGSAWSTDVRAYIYNPTTGAGQFFDYTGEWEGSSWHMIFAAGGTVWSSSYTVAENSQIYILEERRYRLTGDLLQIVRNGAAASAMNIADGVTDLQLRALLAPDPPNPPPVPMDAFGFGDDWTAIRALELSLAGEVPHGETTVARGFTTEVMPRNVLSK